jgi:hypothetical protein
MRIALEAMSQATANKPSRSRMAWLMTCGFLVYTLLILIGHSTGFPSAYAYLHTVCSSGCSLTVENVAALERIGLSIAFYANLYVAIQVLYILGCVGIAVLIVFKKPGHWVPLGLSCFLVGLSAYEGVDYLALTAAAPSLYAPAQLLVGLGMGVLGMYALLTFPNGILGSHWVLVFYLLNVLMVVLAAFITTPAFALINTLFNLLSFPLIISTLIYRYRCLLSAKEQAATKWLIVSLSVFIISLLLIYLVIPAVAPANSLAFLVINLFGFFGCGINIAGFLMAVLYANAFDIDVFVRQTLVYTLLTGILASLYAGMILGSQFVFASFNPQVAQSPLILVASTLVIAALFQPLRRRLQQTIDRRFYRGKYDAAKTVAAFSSTLREEVDLDQLREQLLAVVQETMQPASLSLWVHPLTLHASGEETGEHYSHV